MLSRDAERVYWMMRYIERVEDSAVLLDAYSQAMLDIPEGMQLGWDLLLQITSSKELFYEQYDQVNERNVIKFMLVDEKNPGSLFNSVRAARENARTVRDLIASESWEILNELYWLVKRNANGSIARKHRYDFLSEIKAHCQQFNGLLECTFTRDQTYGFLEMGRYLERADMATRILDVGAGFLLRRRKAPMRFDTLLWMHMLTSLNALVMYRRKIGPRISGHGVVNFLIQDNQFPRSICFSYEQLRVSISRLPRHELALELLVAAEEKTTGFDTHEMEAAQLHDFLDDVQVQLMGIHNAIRETWFDISGDEETSSQSQSQS